MVNVQTGCFTPEVDEEGMRRELGTVTSRYRVESFVFYFYCLKSSRVQGGLTWEGWGPA